MGYMTSCGNAVRVARVVADTGCPRACTYLHSTGFCIQTPIQASWKIEALSATWNCGAACAYHSCGTMQAHASFGRFRI